jgi:hypothetical protein
MLPQRQAGVSVYAMVPVIEVVVDSGPGAGPEHRSDGIGDVVSRRGASQMTAVLALGETPQTARYITHTPEAVGAFLARYPFLVPLLTEALRPLEDAFGTDTPFVVAVETDPEVANWEELRVDVETALPVNEADRRLEIFDTTWWLANLPRAQGKLFFTLAFV